VCVKAFSLYKKKKVLRKVIIIFLYKHSFLGRGRSKVHITKEQLEFLIQENYTAKEMAKHFDCSTKLVYKKCYSFGIKIRNKYYNGSDTELHREISDLHLLRILIVEVMYVFLFSIFNLNLIYSNILLF